MSTARVLALSDWEAVESVMMTPPRNVPLQSEGFSGELPKPEVCARFLNARKHNVEAAVKQYLDMLTWRKEHVPADILGPDDGEPIYQALCPHANHKYDMEGRPIFLEKTGMIDLPKLLKHRTPEQIIVRHIRQQEVAMQRMREESERRGAVVDKQVIILDLKGLSLLPNQTGISLFKETIRIDSSYYPETLGHFYIINAPWIFMPLWALIKPWLDPVTRDKFTVLGGSYQAALLKHIDPASLPVEYGGTCACPGGCIPDLIPLPVDETKGKK